MNLRSSSRFSARPWVLVSSLTVSGTGLAQTPMSPDGAEAPASAPAPATAPASAEPTSPRLPPRPPKGIISAPPIAQLPASAERREAVDCQTYLASPLEGGLIQADKKFYFVSAKLPNDKMPGTTYLVAVDVETGKARRLAGYRGAKSASLIGHGKPLEAVSLLDFGGGRPDCGEGKTAATAIQWAEQKVLPSYPAGDYGYVQGDAGGFIADIGKGAILDIDLKTGQKRTIDTFEPGTRPLYIKSSPPIALYVYNPKTRELDKRVNNQKIAEYTLRLKEDMRLIQEGEAFGVVQYDAAKKLLKISQIKAWSGTKSKSFDIAVPPGVSAASLGAHINFKSSQVLLFGKDEQARRSLKQVFLYRGKDLTATFKATPETYFSAARFGLDRGIALLVNDMGSNVVRELWWVEPGADVKKIDVITERRMAPAEKAKVK